MQGKTRGHILKQVTIFFLAEAQGLICLTPFGNIGHHRLGTQVVSICINYWIGI